MEDHATYDYCQESISILGAKEGERRWQVKEMNGEQEIFEIMERAKRLIPPKYQYSPEPRLKTKELICMKTVQST